MSKIELSTQSKSFIRQKLNNFPWKKKRVGGLLVLKKSEVLIYFIYFIYYVLIVFQMLFFWILYSFHRNSKICMKV